MGHQNIWILCTICKGEGNYSTPAYDEDGNEDGEEAIECDQCDGTGRLLWGYVEKP